MNAEEYHAMLQKGVWDFNERESMNHKAVQDRFVKKIMEEQKNDT